MARKLSNADARLLFLNSAIRKVQWSNPAQTPALGTTLSVVLPKAGIARGLLVTVSLPITIGTAAMVPTAKCPYNVFTNIHLQDYSGIDRVNCSAYGLYLLQIAKARMWEPSSGYPYTLPGTTVTTDPFVAASYPFGLTGQYTPRTTEGGGANTFSASQRWNIPTLVASANLVFSFFIPIA